MAFKYAITTFDVPAGVAPVSVFTATTDVITGLVFDPICHIIFGNNQRDSPFQGGPGSWKFALSDGGSGQIGYATNFGDYLSVFDRSEIMWSTAYCLHNVRNIAINHQIYLGRILNGTGGYTATIDWQGLAPQSGGRFTVVSFGGSDVEAYVNYYQLGTGTLDVTGPGFRPTGLIGYHNAGVPWVSGALNGSGGATSVSATSDGCGGCGLVTSVADTANPSNTSRYQRTTTFAPDLSAGAVATEATISMLANGFRVTKTGGSSSSFTAYLALKGIAVNVVSFNQPATASTVNVPITAAAPRLVMAVGVNGVSSSSVENDCLMSLGVADLTTQRAIWTGDLDNQTPQFRCNSATEDDALIVAHTPTGYFASTLNTRARLVGLRDGFVDVQFLTVDGTARQWVLVVFADLLDAADPCGDGSPIVSDCIPVTIVCPASTTGSVGTAFSSSVTAAHGTTPYTYAITGGALPAGLTLNSSTGAITGTPTTEIRKRFTARVTDGVGQTASIDCAIRITDVDCPTTPAITATSGPTQALPADEEEVAGSCSLAGSLLLETGGYLLLETSGDILLEVESGRPSIGSIG